MLLEEQEIAQDSYSFPRPQKGVTNVCLGAKSWSDWGLVETVCNSMKVVPKIANWNKKKLLNTALYKYPTWPATISWSQRCPPIHHSYPPPQAPKLGPTPKSSLALSQSLPGRECHIPSGSPQSGWALQSPAAEKGLSLAGKHWTLCLATFLLSQAFSVSLCSSRISGEF